MFYHTSGGKNLLPKRFTFDFITSCRSIKQPDPDIRYRQDQAGNRWGLLG